MPNKNSAPPQSPFENFILAALPELDFARLLPDLDSIDLPLGWVISESGDHIDYVYFPVSGIVSLIYDINF